MAKAMGGGGGGGQAFPAGMAASSGLQRGPGGLREEDEYFGGLSVEEQLEHMQEVGMLEGSEREGGQVLEQVAGEGFASAFKGWGPM